MTDIERKAMEMALKFCEDIGDFRGPYPYVDQTTIVGDSRKVLQALHQALEQHKQYDQTALELCEKCGWKAVIPDEGCLVCARKNQKPVGTYEEVMDTMLSLAKGTFEQQQVYTHMKDKPLYTAPVDAVNMTQERVDETAKHEHEPVGYVIRMTGQYHTGDFCGEFQSRTALKQGQVLYTAPPKREHLERLCRIMGTFDLATGHADTMEQALDALESELRDVLGYFRAKREWVGLTDEDRAICVQATVNSGDAAQLMRAIEAKLKEKNT